MINKTLRVLIADAQHFNRMKIERSFNALEYYRIAPVQSLLELLTLVEYGCEPFDVVVINAELAAGSLELPAFFLDNPQVRHALIYNDPSAPLQVFSAFAQDNVLISHAPLPNEQAIRHLMAHVDVAQWKPEQTVQRRAYA
ncbi:chemotaxis protein CheY [Pseudomonas sp. TH08]|uniref:chemotaxis protein CheY n=1 Tax=Pseudomonas sp. TH08 TaxID=2796374 RepID=UPI001913CDD1|nr:chemotaxis protein CheY [Pseudomonas sp. TH08]MBK5535373.1 chemotaxis protein CheY [Pseudomonas sp. TH08]